MLAAGDLLHTILSSDQTLQSNAQEGYSVSASDKYYVTGKPLADLHDVPGAGAVEVYDAASGAHLITIENPEPNAYQFGTDRFGSSVAISGDTLVIGAELDYYSSSSTSSMGSAYIYDLSSGSAVLQATIANPRPDHSDRFGNSVAISGGTVIVGAPLDDVLSGKDGRDVMIGGLGEDKIDGDDGDDILVGGVYIESENRANVHAIMSEWTRTDLDYADRVDHLLNGGGLNGSVVLNATTVFDDNAKDKLKGKKGLDWFLADDDDDKTDLALDELLTDIELDFVNGD